MKDFVKLSDAQLNTRYADLIQSRFGIGRFLAEVLAEKLIDSLISHGGNPRTSEEEAKRNIEIVVDTWLHDDKYIDGTWREPRRMTHAEAQLYGLINHRLHEKQDRLAKSVIDQALYPNSADSPDAKSVLSALLKHGFLAQAADDPNTFVIKRMPGRTVGPEQLIKGYILRYFGARPPILSKRDVQDILRTRLETHELSDPEVQAALAQLEKDGIVRFIGTDEQFLEVLKLPV